MKQQDLEKLCQDSRRVVEETGGFIRDAVGKVPVEQIEVKSLNSLVSFVDKTAEERLVESFNKLLPGSTFLTEEETISQGTGEFQWIIDPLDGTTNFLHQLPCFAISVGLRQNEKTIMGIVYEVNRRECFYSWEKGGVFLNGKPIHVSQTDKLADSLIATGFPYRDYKRLRQYFIALEQLMQKTRGLRRLGAAAVDLAYVACGRFDAFFEYSLSAWDVAAGAFLVQQAGGSVSDFDGGDNFIFGGEMLATNSNLNHPMFEIIREAFSLEVI